MIPGELQDNEVGWRWFISPYDQPFFNPGTDQVVLDVLSEYEIDTLNYNTAIYTQLPLGVIFISFMFFMWCSLGFTHKLITQLGGFDTLEWLRRYNA